MFSSLFSSPAAERRSGVGYPVTRSRLGRVDRGANRRRLETAEYRHF